MNTTATRRPASAAATAAVVEPLEGRALMSGVVLTADAPAPVQVSDGTSNTLLLAERYTSPAPAAGTATWYLRNSNSPG